MGTAELIYCYCSHCNKKYSIKNDPQTIGKKVRCKGCGQFFDIKNQGVKTPAMPKGTTLALKKEDFLEKTTSASDSKASKVSTILGGVLENLQQQNSEPPKQDPQDVIADSLGGLFNEEIEPMKLPTIVAQGDKDQTISPIETQLANVLEEDSLVSGETKVINENMPETKEQNMFGRYRILNEIGAGGMGKVYKAYDQQLDRTVALKVILEGGGGKDAHRRFMREAKATANLNHPNIITCYDFGEQNKQSFFTMEFIEGSCLKTKIINSKPNTKEAIQITIKLCKGIAYAHSKGIVHRDLKPANIMFTEDNEPKIMDFGLAKLTEESIALSKSGMILGTLQYMAPEQAQGKVKEIDNRSDIYALGTMLYELIAGQPPHTGGNNMAILYKIVSEEPKPAHEINKSLPKVLSNICSKAMAKNKEQRYQNANELAQDLEKYLAGNAPVVAPVSSAPKKIARKKRLETKKIPKIKKTQPPKNKYALIAAAVVVFMIAGWAFSGNKKAPLKPPKTSKNDVKSNAPMANVSVPTANISKAKDSKSYKPIVSMSNYNKTNTVKVDKTKFKKVKALPKKINALAQNARKYHQRMMANIDKSNLPLVWQKLRQFPERFRKTPIWNAVQRKMQDIEENLQEMIEGTLENYQEIINKENFEDLAQYKNDPLLNSQEIIKAISQKNPNLAKKWRQLMEINAKVYEMAKAKKLESQKEKWIEKAEDIVKNEIFGLLTQRKVKQAKVKLKELSRQMQRFSQNSNVKLMKLQANIERGFLIANFVNKFLERVSYKIERYASKKKKRNFEVLSGKNYYGYPLKTNEDNFVLSYRKRNTKNKRIVIKYAHLKANTLTKILPPRRGKHFLIIGFFMIGEKNFRGATNFLKRAQKDSEIRPLANTLLNKIEARLKNVISLTFEGPKKFAKGQQVEFKLIITSKEKITNKVYLLIKPGKGIKFVKKSDIKKSWNKGLKRKTTVVTYQVLGHKIGKHTQKATVTAIGRSYKEEFTVDITNNKYGIPIGIWNKTFYKHDDIEILDMASPFWEKLSIKEQQKWAKRYQKAYALSIKQPVNKNMPIPETRIKYPMTLIPPGRFFMPIRDRDSKKTQKVVITRPFWLGKYEVTQKIWRIAVKQTPWEDAEPPVASNSQLPATNISWDDIQPHLNAGFKLPTQAQWVYAYRAGAIKDNYWEDDIHNIAWLVEASQGVQKVGTKESNAWGLYDMIGNAGEWCRDQSESYEVTVDGVLDPVGTEGGCRIIRGGCIITRPEHLENDHYYHQGPDDKNGTLGFRLIRAIGEEPVEDDNREENNENNSPRRGR